MLVREIMTRGVESVQANQTVLDAAEMMKRLDVGAVPVFEGNRAAGIITDRDIVIRIVASGFNPQHISVGEVMSKGVQSCSEDTSIEDAARIMENYKIRRLLVRDSNGDITGILSLGDLAVHVNKAISGEIIHDISEPNRPHRSE